MSAHRMFLFLQQYFFERLKISEIMGKRAFKLRFKPALKIGVSLLDPFYLAFFLSLLGNVDYV